MRSIRNEVLQSGVEEDEEDELLVVPMMKPKKKKEERKVPKGREFSFQLKR